MTSPVSRASARKNAILAATSRNARKFERPDHAKRVSDYFAENVFTFEEMKKTLPSEDVNILQQAAITGQKIDIDMANKVALAVKEWALSKGASHYTHWFQPQTGSTAEKHDSFFDFDADNLPVEKFTGKDLIQQEPDASSFPSGGRRETFEARGYTIWDASSPMFLTETENGKTLTIPSLFVSYSGEALDKKTPLLRSVQALNTRAIEALKLLGDETGYVEVNCGPEQEFFVLDEALVALRPDLQLADKTVIGRGPQKGQQLDDHYFGSIKPRVLNMLMEVEHELIKLGIPVKTRHNEVAPAQFEMAPIFENANIAADHNQLVMDTLKQVAKKHSLVVLLHEKPFAGLNGSGKHLNWSISTAEGVNLLSPGDMPHENIRFLYFLAATLKGLKDNGDLLRASVAVPGNDFRMGANEAPPAVISAFLGDTLTEVVEKIKTGATGDLTSRASTIDLDLAKVPVIRKDNTDRNRTSPFAFTGNKFEFRALGSSQTISVPIVYLNAAVSKALDMMNDQLSSLISSGTSSEKAALAVVSQVFSETDAVVFNGDGYSAEWEAEAAKRGLSNFRTTPEALAVLTKSETAELFTSLGIMAHPEELNARYNVFMERYVMLRMIELETASELLRTHVLPAAIEQQKSMAIGLEAIEEVIGKYPANAKAELENVVAKTEALISGINKLDHVIAQVGEMESASEAGLYIAKDGAAALETVRAVADEIEGLVDDNLWTLPKYRELLFNY